MSRKITAIIKIVNLLNSRQRLTLEDIKRECDLPARTVYRYLNSLSEANIPIYFDRGLGGYTLSNRRKNQIGATGVDEAIILTLALDMLSARLNNEYCSVVEDLAKRISSGQPISTTDLCRSVAHRNTRHIDARELSELITSLVIKAALTLDKGLELIESIPGEGKKRLVIQRPSLWFKDNWQVQDADEECMNSVWLSNIERARIL